MHLYIHVPFCDGKCSYCGFYSVHYREQDATAYLAALENEMRQEWKDGAPSVSSVYMGGGTPSVLEAGQLAGLCGLIGKHCKLENGYEWTVEGSPNTLTADRVQLLADAGVNRISIGIQTFDDVVLKALGRRHSADQAASLLEYLAGREDLRTGCDLIAGLPGLSEARWREDVRKLCRSGVKHASVYALSLEEGTPLFSKYREGVLDAPDSDETADRLEECCGMLGEAGLRRYEVSNYAVMGEECRHNLAYWHGGDFLGLGPGASSRLGRLRRTNEPDVAAYLAGKFLRREEHVCRSDDLHERMMYHFRLKEGIDLAGFCRAWKVGKAMRDQWKERLDSLIAENLVQVEGGRYAPTLHGMDFADFICETLLA